MINPKDLALVSKNKENLKGKNAEYNSEKILEIYKGKFEIFSICRSNVAAGLIVSGKENDFKNAYDKASTHLAQEMFPSFDKITIKIMKIF